MKQNKLLVLMVAAFFVAGLIFAYVWKGRPASLELNAGNLQTTGQSDVLPELHADLLQILAEYRKIIVLFADEKKLSAVDKDAANQVGQAIFHKKLSYIANLESHFEVITASNFSKKFELLGNELDYIESDSSSLSDFVRNSLILWMYTFFAQENLSNVINMLHKGTTRRPTGC